MTSQLMSIYSCRLSKVERVCARKFLSQTFRMSSVLLEATFVWRLFADENLTFAKANLCRIKWDDFVASLTWT